MQACADGTGGRHLPIEAYRLEVVSFRCGGFRMAVETRQVHRLLGSQELLSAAALTPIEALLGLPAAGEGVPPEGAAGERSRCQLQIGASEFGVEVTGPAELASIPAASIFGLPALVTAGCSLEGLQAIALDEAGPILIVDLLATLEARGIEPASRSSGPCRELPGASQPEP